MFTLKEVTYKDILRIQNLHLPPNKVTCIVGESGSGKTTLLRLLNKLISCDSGEILYQGQSLKEINSIDLRRKVVMLPQTPAIFQGTIKDNLLIGLKFAEKPLLSEEELYNILKLVHLDKNIKENAEKLSGGEKQRVALGRVLLLKPEVLLLDEPSSALDEKTEHMMISSLVSYAKENHKSLIMVTHSKKVATNFADHLIEIRNGMIVKEEEV